MVSTLHTFIILIIWHHDSSNHINTFSYASNSWMYLLFHPCFDCCTSWPLHLSCTSLVIRWVGYQTCLEQYPCTEHILCTLVINILHSWYLFRTLTLVPLWNLMRLFYMYATYYDKSTSIPSRHFHSCAASPCIRLLHIFIIHINYFT